MHSLDFISQSPQTFIFKKEANKTNLGGVLFFIYLIACSLIFLYYLLDYINNNKYEIQYSLKQNFSKYEDMNRILQDDKLNPKTEASVIIYDENGYDLSENFIVVIYDDDLDSFISSPYGLNFSKRFCDIHVRVYYKCISNYPLNCSLRKEDKRSFYTLSFIYKTFYLDHQNSSSPIADVWSLQPSRFSFENKILKNYDWQIIKYKDRGGLLSTEKEYFAGSVKSNDIFIYDEPYIIKNEFESYVYVYGIKINSLFDYYDEYVRTEISWMNIFSNSFSLWMSLYSAFKMVFDFLYAKNFNNYKIIQQILSKNEKLNSNVKNSKNIVELKSVFNKSEQLINNQNAEKEIILTDDIGYKEKQIQNNNEYNEYQNNIIDEEAFELPKLHLFDFILNNIYLSKKCNFKKQNMISAANEIVSNYFTIERILLNQIIFENLMKDYRWNNPRLRGIHNNELIIKLKNYILNS